MSKQLKEMIGLATRIQTEVFVDGVVLSNLILDRV